MLVKEFLKENKNDKEIIIFQVPIKEIDSCEELVKRYEGEITISLSSNQNYLDFVVLFYFHDNEKLVIICKANEEQEKKIILAHKKH